MAITKIEFPITEWRGLIYFYPESLNAKNNTQTHVILPKPCLGIPERFGEGYVVLHYYISQLAHITDILNTKGAMCFFDETKSPGEAGIGHGEVGS